VNELNDHGYKQILDLTFLVDLYTFDLVKSTVKKLHLWSSGVALSFSYFTAVAMTQPDPIVAMTYVFQSMCNKLIAPALETQALTLRHTVLALYLRWQEMVCYNCLKPKYVGRDCTLVQVPYEQYRTNQEEVHHRLEE
jgi:hypothetical protein